MSKKLRLKNIRHKYDTTSNMKQLLLYNMRRKYIESFSLICIIIVKGDKYKAKLVILVR